LPQRWTAARKERILQSRLNAGQAVVEAITAAEKKPRVLIQASGIDYYGHVEGEQPVTEASPSGSGFLAGVTQQWEKSTEGVAEMGVRRAVMRTAIVLSMNGGPLPATVLPFKFFVGGPLGSGRQWWPWIHLHDKVRVIQFLLQNESATGVFNVCTPNPVPNKQFAKAIGKAMKRPSFMPAPAFVLRLILGEMAAIVLDGRRAIPQRLQEMGFTFTYPEIDDALANLLD
jgi:uncharacterized protein (TIGR01777 family)